MTVGCGRAPTVGGIEQGRTISQPSSVLIIAFQINNSYPHEPPKVKCLTPVYHPNIDFEGNICLNILRYEQLLCVLTCQDQRGGNWEGSRKKRDAFGDLATPPLAYSFYIIENVDFKLSLPFMFYPEDSIL